MWRIRAFEERVGELTRADEVHGLVHLSVGQEAVAVGVCGQLRPDDAVYSNHRAHGHAIAKGAPLERVMAELMGREDGLCRGLGGSMHLVDVEHGFLGATGVVGGNVPLALGSALAGRLLGGDQVAVVFFGDGAVQGGIFVESVNLATLWRLPGDPRLREQRLRRVHAALGAHERRARERRRRALRPRARDRRRQRRRRRRGPRSREFLAAARRGDGPFLLECLTHRLRGHYEGDPQRYRQALAADEWQELDPILRLQRRGVEEGWLDERRAVAARAGGARARSRRRSRFARESPFPPASLTAELVYAHVTQTTYLEAITTTLAEAMRADPRVLVLGEDVAEGGPWGATAGLAEEFGAERVRNTPISEAAICGVAIGAAQSGLRPVVEIMFVDFLTLALDQLVNQAAKAHFMSGGQLAVPLVLRTQGGAGQRGGAQHSQSLEAWLTHVPGLKVAMPSTAADAAGLLATAIADPNPVVFVENKTLYFRRGGGPGRAGAGSARPRERRAAGPRRHRRRALAARPRVARGGRRARGGGDRGRGDRPAHARPARPRGDRRVGAQDAPARRRARGGRARRLRRRDRRPGAGGGVRRPRRADRARRRAVRAGAVQPAARGRVPARPRRRGRSRPSGAGMTPFGMFERVVVHSSGSVRLAAR